MRTIRSLTAGLMLCSAVPVAAAHAQEWYAYRHDTFRTGTQPFASGLSDPTKVRTLAFKPPKQGWVFPDPLKVAPPNCPRAGQPAVGGFKASPIVVNDTVFIGSQDGYFYALDAVSGACEWQYPAGDKALLGGDATWAYGIMSSAAYWDRPPNGAVIFAAQDPSLGPSCPQGKPANSSCGSARLFALDAKFGTEIWKSDLIAEINGDCTNTNPQSGCQTTNTELHQRTAHSSPLVFNDKVYVGISNFKDNPIQVGRVIAVELTSGHIDPTFQFRAVGTSESPPGTVRGGGVWNSPAADSASVYFTTGNTRKDGGNPPQTEEPNPNHGLSMLRVDRNTGNIIWAFQPVPFALDDDPDWAAGATVMSTSCGELIASVQKDGYSYAINAGNGTPGPPSVRWQFPPTGYPFTPAPPPSTFTDTNGFDHGDNDYKRPGAAWNDVLIISAGGESLVQDGVTAGYGKLHALNACASTENTRVRWIAGIPYTKEATYPPPNPPELSLGAPTVTGGIVFIGTDLGYLVVLADPSVWPPIGYTCSNPDYPVDIGDDHCEPHCREIVRRLNCLQAGYAIVPIPQELAIVVMPDGGSIGGIRNEPALAKGRVFVGTMNGHVYMMEP